MWKGSGMNLPPKKTRKHLSADALFSLVRSRFERIPDGRNGNATIGLPDALMSAFGMFSLKDPSLLAFDGHRNDQNMKNIYQIKRVPSDSRMREILDPIDPLLLRPAFGDVFRQLQRGKALEPMVFHDGCYLLSVDGTGYFSSQKIHCNSCLRKTNKKGVTTYYHQLLSGVIVHPNFREVIPLAPESITQQDGTDKNDCERNAGKRLLRRIRQEHPHLKLIVVQDGLSSHGPHIRELMRLNMHFLLAAKPGDHAYLFDQLIAAHDSGRATVVSWTDQKKVQHEITFINQVPLNESHPDLLVNFLEYIQSDADGKQLKHFTWVTDLQITKENCAWLVRGGRARWRVENETFNTLKNQGYNLEHNYGHGNQNLSVVFAMLMMLAFLIDQVQQRTCPLFQAVWKHMGSKRALWEKLRSHFYHFTFQSMGHLYEVMLHGLARNLPPPTLESS